MFIYLFIKKQTIKIQLIEYFEFDKSSLWNRSLTNKAIFEFLAFFKDLEN